jgi:hypothetical protein
VSFHAFFGISIGANRNSMEKQGLIDSMISITVTDSDKTNGKKSNDCHYLLAMISL